MKKGRVFDLKLSYRAANNTRSLADQNLLVSDEIMLAFGHYAGCKENHFHSLPFGQAEASIY